ncbi:MAG: 1-acyl-sn-glycerol-3-phosphate acyltransferase [Proteobacteria bacterium]|nr:1-acyl-sn-glycerol-3-phosphate acyltransferase [Pseudomonadota bacterium]
MSQVRSALFYVWLFAVIAVMAVVCAPCLLMPRRALTAGQRVWAALVLGGLRVICGVRVEARGLEHRPAGPGLIAAKHQSMLDGIAPFAFLRDPSFVLKKELLANPVYGAYGRKAELVSLDRDGGAAALKALITEVRDRLGKRRPVIIFPEGTRRPPGGEPDYKPGVAGLYRELDGPVVPMATNSGLRWPAKGWVMRPGTAVYEFLPPIAPGLKRGAFMAELQSRVETASEALRMEGEARG